ncbi:MAG: DUF4097 domain-containing protein [Clostridiales bacterium]|nr:DUF4097 domain-containing protein [Clostridiales bacterium]
MEEIKRRFIDTVAGKLAAAPQSTAKDELVEELSDNLYRRFLDMTGAGMDDETAFTRAMEDLGDVDELLAYLGAETAGDHQSQGAAEGGEEPQSNPGAGAQSDLDAILASVSEACNTAIDQAKAALKQAKEAIQRRTSVEKDSGHVRVHFNTRPDDPTPPTPPAPPETPETPTGTGWEFEAEVNTDEGRFFAGGGPRQQRDVIYGFGYDKAKGGFFTQWGEWKGQYRSDGEGRGPHFSGQDSSMEGNDDGSYSVSALKDLRGIVVQTVAGDVTIRDDGAPDAGVIIDGDVDDLDVTCSADGILTIREGRTASSSFFSRRGIGSADVELSLPRRRWELLNITTASGDVELDGFRLDVDQLCVKTASGDLNASLHACGELRFHSASGDLELDLKDGCADLHAETMSGDVCVHGQVGDAMVKTASGDIEMDGLAVRFLGGSMSGDIRLETSQLPQVMELSSKSGDVEARIPDAGPFTLRYKTVSGDVNFAFPFQYQGGTAIYGDGSGPAYVMTTVSGDVNLDRY